jgi:hypothetical protein
MQPLLQLQYQWHLQKHQQQYQQVQRLTKVAQESQSFFAMQPCHALGLAWNLRILLCITEFSADQLRSDNTVETATRYEFSTKWRKVWNISQL